MHGSCVGHKTVEKLRSAPGCCRREKKNGMCITRSINTLRKSRELKGYGWPRRTDREQGRKLQAHYNMKCENANQEIMSRISCGDDTTRFCALEKRTRKHNRERGIRSIGILLFLVLRGQPYYPSFRSMSAELLIERMIHIPFSPCLVVFSFSSIITLSPARIGSVESQILLRRSFDSETRASSALKLLKTSDKCDVRTGGQALPSQSSVFLENVRKRAILPV